MRFNLVDSRRLTGPNLFSPEAGAICEVDVDEDRRADFASSWLGQVGELLKAVGWSTSRCWPRIHETGLSLVITAPIDALYAATEVNEAAVERARRELLGMDLEDQERVRQRLLRQIAAEANPRLLALKEAAERKRRPLLWDDDKVSIGYGKTCQTWPAAQLPDPDDVAWDDISPSGAVPVALVTGTNGKSTTVRLAASIVEASGRRVGVTSTDNIRVGHELLDKGDYSGPGGARTLLRHPDTEVALLEVARGGMLRRGLGVVSADCAVVTNVAADHLGEYGIHTVEELREAKFIVRKALTQGKPLVLNADDKGIVEYARQLPAQLFIWFSQNSEHPVIQGHCMAGGKALVAHEGMIKLRHQQGFSPIMPIVDIPITLNGQAGHNVQNALAAAAIGHALGCDDTAIIRGLRSFRGTPEENPGRGNIITGKGIKAIVDFAHNEHGLTAVAQTLAAMPARRRLVLMGQAGDRSDELIEGLTRAALKAKPDQLVVCQLPGYERGRPPTEVPALIENVAVRNGMDPDAIHHADSPVTGTRFALSWARPGDLLLILALTQRGPCLKLLQEQLGRP